MVHTQKVGSEEDVNLRSSKTSSMNMITLALKLANIGFALTNIPLIIFGVIKKIGDNPPQYLGSELSETLWNFGGAIGGFNLMLAIAIALVLTLVPYNSATKWLTRLSLFNMLVSAVSILSGMNVPVKINLAYAAVLCFFCYVIHFARVKTLQIAEKNSINPEKKPMPMNARKYRLPLVGFTYFVVAVELVVLWYARAWIGEMIFVALVVAVSFFLNLVLFISMIYMQHRYQTLYQVKLVEDRKISVLKTLACVICLWPMMLTVIWMVAGMVGVAI